MEEEEEEINLNWLNEFENEYSFIENLNNEDVKNVNYYFIYINSDKVIERINSETIILETENIVNKYDLLQKINNLINKNKDKYKLISLLKYNIDLNKNEIKNFFNDKEDDFLKAYTLIEDIKFKKTLNMFKSLNSIFFIFYEKKIRDNKTKRIKIKTNKKTRRNYN